MYDTVVSHSTLTLTGNTKAYTVVTAALKINLLPTGNNIAVLYDAPFGSLYEFKLTGEVTKIESEDKFTVTVTKNKSLTVGDKFIVVGNPYRVYLNGGVVHTTGVVQKQQ
jgi:hypothetical protein